MNGIRKSTYNILAMVTALMSLLIVSACEHNFYETGDSELSYLHTDFVEARTDEMSAFVSAVTDEGRQLILKPVVKELWATKADTTYRALLYYNKVEKGVTSSFVINPVVVLRPRLENSSSSSYNDPIGFESVWMSKNRKYLNLTLIVKTGKTEDKKAVQSLAVICDSIKSLSSGRRIVYLRLMHHQNKVPEYYSRRVFTSIPLNEFRQNDSICLDMNTYKGKISKRFVY